MRRGDIDFLCLQLLAGLLLLSSPAWAGEFEPDESFQPMGKVISLEGDIEHFESDRLNSAFINAWNLGGVLLKVKYHLVHLHYWRFVPWIGGAIGPGGSDLNIGQVSDDSKLTGPFLALIEGEVGVSYFLDSRRAAYLGLQAQHVSNASLNGRDGGSSRNISLNTPWGLVAGISWFLD
jgi:hypothetical protein